MRIWVIGSLKGGSGKSVLTRLLAVHLAAKHTVAVVDADPQHSLAAWARRRTVPPAIRVYTTLTDALETRPEYVLVDTPPAMLSVVREMLRNASFVVIPTRGSFDDLESVEHMVAEARAARKPYGLVISAYDGRVGYAKQIKEQLGKVLLGTVGYRKGFFDASEFGETGIENSPAADRKSMTAEVAEIVKNACAAEAAHG